MAAATPSRSVEVQDAITLLICLIVIPLCWALFFSWSWDKAISGHDGWINSLWLQDLIQHRGNWQEHLYRFEIFGGVKAHDTLGSAPLWQLAGVLGLATTTAANFSVFFMQIFIGFVGLKSIGDLTSFWIQKRDFELPVFTRVAGLWLISFAPVLAWRLSYGHDNLVYGTWVFLAAFSLLVSAQANRTTWVQLCLVVLGLCHAFQTAGFQLVVYSAVFGGPILIGCLLLTPFKKENLKQFLLLPALLFFAALAFSAPKLSGMLAQAFGEETGRNLTGPPATYSYITATLGDWVSSIPWSKYFIPTGRGADLHHEVNFPFGPLLILLALIPWKKHKPLLYGIITSVLLAVLFSMDFKPVSVPLLTLISPLKGFRVPERAILFFSLILPIFSIAGLTTRFHNPSRNHSEYGPVLLVAGVVLALVLATLPELVTESALWILCMAVVFALTRNNTELRQTVAKWGSPALVTTILIVLGTGGLLAFQDRLMPYNSAHAYVDVQNIAGEIKKSVPELSNPLYRVALNIDIGGFSVDSGYAAGLSGIDGYTFPLRRFVQLTSALEHKPYSPMSVFLGFGNSPAFQPLTVLYNIIAQVNQTEGTLRVNRLGPKAGPAWFSQSVIETDSLESLATQIWNAGDHLTDQTKEKMWVLGSDSKVQAAAQSINPARSLNPLCAGAKVISTDAHMRDQNLTINVESPANCPLTISANYNSQMIAHLDHQSPIELFPAYGALVAMVIPAGSHTIDLTTVPLIPGWVRIFWWSGFLFLFGAYWIQKKKV